jgi:hypothetical protein
LVIGHSPEVSDPRRESGVGWHEASRRPVDRAVGRLSLVTDLGLGQPAHHMLPAAWIGMLLGERFGLRTNELARCSKWSSMAGGRVDIIPRRR